MGTRGGRGARRLGLAAVCLVFGAITTMGHPAGAAPRGAVTFSAKLDDRSLEQVDLDRPLHLHPHRTLDVVVTVANAGPDAVFVRSVRIATTVLGLPLFAYSTRVDLEVQPGRSGSRHFAVDFSDVGSQATGLFRAKVTLLGHQRAEIASSDVIVQVHGSLFSVFGGFGLGVLAMSAVLLLSALGRLATGRLPASRWGRAVPFGVAGVGVGISLMFLLTTLSIEPCTAGTCVVLMVIGLGAGLGFGFLTPRIGASSGGGDRPMVSAGAA